MEEGIVALPVIPQDAHKDSAAPWEDHWVTNLDHLSHVL